MSKKEVKEHVILYLDVLGYRELVLNCAKYGKTENDYLHKIYSLMEDLSEYIDKRNQMLDDKYAESNLKMTNFKWRMFSDNIVFFAPADTDVEMYNLGSNLLYGLSLFLFSYKKADLFFRGAITRGLLYYSDELGILYGSGLIKAYDIECEIAKYPRIIIDECFNPDGLLVGLERNGDGVGYLNYLSLAYNIATNERNLEPNSNEARKLFEPYISNYSQAISAALKRYDKEPKVYDKYIYLAKYINGFCRYTGYDEYIIVLP